jgi:hypothetical protein
MVHASEPPTAPGIPEMHVVWVTAGLGGDGDTIAMTAATNLFQDNLVGVDFCEQMVRETNPGVLARAEKTPAPGAARHG